MATTNLAAKRYSRAVFELALEQGNLSSWQTAVDQIAAFMQQPDAAQVLENTRISQEAKLGLVGAILGSLSPIQQNLARLLIRKNRTALASEIAVQFRQLVQAQSGIDSAKATTAVALSDAERDALAQRLQERTGRQIVLETEVDPAVLGGVVVQIGDRLIDASTRAKLHALRESLVGAL